MSFNCALESNCWLLNGLVLNASRHVTIQFDEPFGIGVVMLSQLQPQLNNTHIECVTSGVVGSSSSTLLLQGKGNLHA